MSSDLSSRLAAPQNGGISRGPLGLLDLVLRKLARALIRFYQVALSPLLPPGCRFVPSCSEYALEAYERHGFLRGSLLTLSRLLRCHPGCPSGYDPVPEAKPDTLMSKTHRHSIL